MERTKVLTYSVALKRVTKKRLSPEKLKSQIRFIADSVKRNRTSNWEVSIPKKSVQEIPIGDDVHYSAIIKLTKKRYMDEDAVKRNFQNRFKVMERAARRQKWTVTSEESMTAGSIEVQEIPEPVKRSSPYITGEQSLPLLSDLVLVNHFSRLYERDSHIRIVYDNLCLAVKTKFKIRHHLLLKGLPSCAKTELFLAFIDWFGEDLFEQIDASTMTKAGLERLLLDKAENGTLKPILILEEIEKCHNDNISCLIQLMDSRGKIQRVNARVGNASERAPIIVWATCNGEDQLRKAHDGAIWSRFATKMNCERPTRELMKKILVRECGDIGGNVQWVEPVLDFCYGKLAEIPHFKLEYNDPRFVRAFLAGGNRLLDGSYFEDFKKTNRMG